MADNNPTTRPVLTVDDLHFITEGLERILAEVSKAATAAARNGDYERAGETLQVGNDCSDLLKRMQVLRTNLIEELIDQQMAETMVEEDESLPTDDVGTIPMEAYEDDAVEQAEG